MDTKTPTPVPDIVLDYPIDDLQISVLQLTDQVKQLQSKLDAQTEKFNKLIQPMEIYLKNEDKKKQKREEAQSRLNFCGTERMMIEERKREKENQKIDKLRRGFKGCGTGDIIKERMKRVNEKENQIFEELRREFKTGDSAGREAGKKNNAMGRVRMEGIIVCGNKGVKEVGEPSRGRREGEGKEKVYRPS